MMKILTIGTALLITGCTSSETKTSQDSAAVTSTATDPAAEAITLSAADLDGFEKGLAHEIHLVKEGKEQARRATTAVARGNAIQSTFEENTMAKAVPASGLSLERYRLVRQTLSRLLTTLDFQGKIDGPQSVDTAFADAEMKARIASDPYSALDRSSAELLKGRLDRVVPLWIEYINLTVVGG